MRFITNKEKAMLNNYFKIAIRNILRNKIYASINILGLAMGLVIYIFGNLFADYEYTHDTFFKNVERTYTLTSIFGPESNFEGMPHSAVYSAIAPILRSEYDEPEAIARTIIREYLISVDDNHYYHDLRFTDPDLLQIFDFNYISGSPNALDNSNGAVITVSIAEKFFGDENPIGKTITLDHTHSFQISAVIEDLPPNTHFNSQIVPDVDLEILLPIAAFVTAADYNPDENFGNLSDGNLTYVLLPDGFGEDWLQTQVASIHDRHYDDERKKFIAGLSTNPLIRANLSLWDTIGIPAIDVVKYMGLGVLLIACVNYTNLATAQSMGRAREVGLRKTLGAGPKQLLIQFITESITITIISMILALTLLELLLPLFNTATEKILMLDYASILPWLLTTILLVGIISGSYPAYLITKTSPIEALRDGKGRNQASSWVRSSMIAVQFVFSVFMLALVLVIFAQNKNVRERSNIFPKDQIYTLARVDVDQIENRHELLKTELKKIPGVENVTYSSQVPFEPYQNGFTTSRDITDIKSGFNIMQITMDQDFFDTYGLEIVAGRKIGLEQAMDTHVRENGGVNVIVNELAARSLGFKSNEEAIGQQFYEDEGEGGITAYTIVGVSKDTNIMGLHQKLPSYIFFMRPASYRHLSIKLSSEASIQTISEIENTWSKVIPDYPMQGQFLDDHFQFIYSIFEMASNSLAALAMFALILALIGLFGLAAYMAEQRTREIGIRKVLGANSLQIVRLLILQFSRPVLWALPFSLGLAFLASNLYLELFDERIDTPILTLVISGIIGLLLSWLTVAAHALKVARTNPINALYHE